MTKEDIAFCEANMINFESVELGFIRNIDHPILDEYARIYQRSLDPSFVLNAWCGSCNFSMLKRLKHHYENVISAQQVQPTNQPNDKIQAKNPRGRKSK
jgi:hypothetical protein